MTIGSGGASQPTGRSAAHVVDTRQPPLHELIRLLRFMASHAPPARKPSAVGDLAARAVSSLLDGANALLGLHHPRACRDGTVYCALCLGESGRVTSGRASPSKRSASRSYAIGEQRARRRLPATNPIPPRAQPIGRLVPTAMPLVRLRGQRASATPATRRSRDGLANRTNRGRVPAAGGRITQAGAVRHR
jgi:hypothetical protein